MPCCFLCRLQTQADAPALKQSFLNEIYIKLILGLVMNAAGVILSFYYPVASIVIIVVSFMIYLIPPTPPEYEDSHATQVPERH